MSDTVFPQYPVASWQAKGRRAIAFTVEQLQENGGNRLVPHERPRRNGAKHDDTGSMARSWQIATSFHTTVDEPGIDAASYYPQALNDLIASFDVHEVGDLTLPTRGPVRCRAKDYSRTERSDERDCATVTFTFVEDNEDGVLTSSFVNPSARSTAVGSAEAAAFTLESLGLPSTDFGSSLATFASEVEALANAPAEFVADLQTKATQVQSATDRILSAFGSGDGEAGAMLLDPTAALVHRQLAMLADTCGRVVGEKLSNLPRLRAVTFTTTVGIPQVAAKYRQDIGALLAANPKLGNPFAIPAGTPINVYAS